MSSHEFDLLDACLEGDRAKALLLAKKGEGLRNYCPKRDMEPLVASAQQGYPDVFKAILKGSDFEPFDSSLNKAMGAATAAGHLGIALKCFLFGAEIEWCALDLALDHGRWETLCDLMREGAITSDPVSPEIPSAIDHLFSACCVRGMESEAIECIQRGASLTGQSAEDSARALAETGMQACAAFWMGRTEKISPAIQKAWEKAFPQLMLSQRERRELAAPDSSPNPTPSRSIAGRRI